MKGICFKEPLFNKVAAGEKTQTRRIIPDLPPEYELVGMGNTGYTVWQHPNKDYTFGAYPRYRDEIIYLKEPYFVWEPEHCRSMSERFAYKYWDKPDKMNAEIQEAIRKEEFKLGYETYYWHNKLFMPERAARYFIKITNIRVQRLNDITEADAIAEGLKGIADFQNIWITIHGWSSLKENPWVFAYTFELTNKPIL